MTIEVNPHFLKKVTEESVLQSRKLTSVADRMDTVTHLIRVAVLACDSIEDIDSRNAFVALLAEIEGKVKVCSDDLRCPSSDLQQN